MMIFVVKMFKIFVKICFSMPDFAFRELARTIQNEHNIISVYDTSGSITNKFLIFCKLFYDNTGEIRGTNFEDFKQIFGQTRVFCRFLHENKILSAEFYERANILYVMLENEEHEAIFGKICFLWDEIKRRHQLRNKAHPNSQPDSVSRTSTRSNSTTNDGAINDGAINDGAINDGAINGISITDKTESDEELEHLIGKIYDGSFFGNEIKINL